MSMLGERNLTLSYQRVVAWQIPNFSREQKSRYTLVAAFS